VHLDGADPSPIDVFERLVQAVAGWAPVRPPWAHVQSTPYTSFQTGLPAPSLTSQDVLAHAREVGQPGRRLMTCIPVECWVEREDGGLVRGRRMLSVEAWDAAFRRANDGDLDLPGAGVLSFGDCSPFVSTWAREPQHAAAFGENVCALLDLVERVATGTGASSLQLYTPDGVPLPFNTHLAYYCDDAAVSRDVERVKSRWSQI
jgi:hypothetical protein